MSDRVEKPCHSPDKALAVEAAPSSQLSYVIRDVGVAPTIGFFILSAISVTPYLLLNQAYISGYRVKANSIDR
jgi:hypothetical protein